MKAQAALAYIVRNDGKILCVWNRRYKGWGLPGGKVEPGETIEAALVRELHEETGLEVASFSTMYDAPTVTSDSGRQVYVFRVWPVTYEAKLVETDSPVDWKTKEDLIGTSPFASFYTKMFAQLEKMP